MKKIFSILLLFLTSTGIFAQAKWEDVCHAYIVDVAKATSFEATGNEEKDAKALQSVEKVFPEFRTIFKEETLTTKHYPFPNSSLIITASVYYTDETLASHPTGKYEVNTQSIVLGIMVSAKAQESAISAETPNAAIVETTYDDYTNMIRVKQYVKVNNQPYLIGLECDCAAKNEKINSAT